MPNTLHKMSDGPAYLSSPLHPWPIFSSPWLHFSSSPLPLHPCLFTLYWQNNEGSPVAPPGGTPVESLWSLTTGTKMAYYADAWFELYGFHQFLNSLFTLGSSSPLLGSSFPLHPCLFSDSQLSPDLDSLVTTWKLSGSGNNNAESLTSSKSALSANGTVCKMKSMSS